MIRFLLVFAGFMLLALAFVQALLDGTRSISSGRLSLTWVSDSLGPWLQKYAQFQTIEGGAAKGALLGAEHVPLALALAALGAILLLMGRRPRDSD